MTREIPLTKRREHGEASPAADAELRLTNISEQYARLVHDAIIRSGHGTAGSSITSEQESDKRLRNVVPGDRSLKDLASYIYGVAVTATIDAVRHVKANRQEQPDAAEEEEDSGMNSRAPGRDKAGESVAQAHEVAQKVRESLGFLIESRRRTVGLSLEGFTIREIADLMSWSELKTRNTLYRGLKDLRRQLRSVGIDYETE
jgi:DNA-directed RNA polymerase specialized sigma24 family protein